LSHHAHRRASAAPFWAGLVLLFAASSAFAALPVSTAQSAHVEISLVANVTAVAPGQPFWAALRLKMESGWHTYWANPGDSGEPTQITWLLPPGCTAGPTQWPTPVRLPVDPTILNYGYEGDLILPILITPPASLQPGSNLTLSASVTWLECAQICLPGSANLSLTLPIQANPASDPRWQPAIAATLANLPQPPSSFNVSAWRRGGQLFLGFVPKPGATVPAEFTDVYFFSLDSQTVPSAPQTWRRSGTGWILAMTRADSAPAQAQSLPGVLVTAGSWTSNGTVPALSLNPPLAAAPPAEFSGETSAAPALGLTGFLNVLVLAFFGGLILNVMPCVFPVLGLKVLGFVKQAGEERRHVVLHGLVFTAGVVISLWVLVGLLLSLRAAGAQLGWGFQLQEPGFVLGLAVFFLLFALSLSGVFEIGGSAIGVGSNLTAKSGLAGSFFQGVLAIVVATPCTAPLLAPALGAAFTLPGPQAFLAFTFIALGLASPYLALSLFPGLARWLPRPGAWMETFKQLMAFFLYATVAFLLYVLAGQLSSEKFLDVLFALVVVAFAAWLYGRYATPSASPARRRFGQLGGLAVLAAALALAYWPDLQITWEPWSPQRVAELQSTGRPVYVDFTARWCATCQLNKHVVFGSQAVLDALVRDHVALLEADWTNRDPAITAELTKYGPPAVPLDLLYLPGHSDPIVLPKLLTPDIVLDALGNTTVSAPPSP
jgi:thiol:disulfide interchange protein DsbD